MRRAGEYYTADVWVSLERLASEITKMESTVAAASFDDIDGRNLILNIYHSVTADKLEMERNVYTRIGYT